MALDGDSELALSPGTSSLPTKKDQLDWTEIKVTSGSLNEERTGDTPAGSLQK